MTSSHVLQHRGQPSTAEQGLADSLAFRIIVTALYVILAFWLTGCSSSFEPKLSGAEPGGPGGTVGNVLKGQVHGGQQPVAGAYVFVFQVGEAGYPGPGVPGNVSIISSTTTGSFNGSIDGNSYGSYVLSDSNGNFSFNLNNCTVGDGVYIASLGGQAITGETNSAESEMAALGICPAGGISALIASTPFVNLNEVSTVAFAYAMGGFTAAGYDFSHVSTSATNITGMQNAFMLAQQLFSVSTTGGANTSSASLVGATFDAGKINLMANVLSDCINSAGNTGSSSPCYTLLQNATSNGTAGSGTIPSDTASAMINITHNVLSNVSTILNLANNSYAPFTPTTTTATGDLSLSVTYPLSSYGSFDPYEIRVDSSSYVYAISDHATQSQATPVATKISPTTGVIGTATLSGGAGTVYLAAIDEGNDILLLNTSSQSVYEYGSSTTAALGTQASGSPFNLSSILSVTSDGPYLATQEFIIGPYNNIEISNRNGNNIVNVPFINGTYSASSSSVVSSDYNPNDTFAIAENGNGTTFESDSVGFVTSYTSGSMQTFGTQRNTNIALDNQSNVYAPDNNNNNLSYIVVSTGSVNTLTGSGLNSPQELVSDGLSNVWVVNHKGCSISRFLNGSGIYSGGLPVIGCSSTSLSGIGIDPAGNLWLAMGSNSSTSGYVVEIVGVAAPTIAPISLLSTKILTSNTSITDLRP